MQERVRQFLLRNGIECGAEYRCLDLASEVGEVAKEILRGSSYGKEPYAPTPETEEELEEECKDIESELKKRPRAKTA